MEIKKVIRAIIKSKDEKILQAPIPPRIIPKGMVDESLLAHIIIKMRYAEIEKRELIESWESTDLSRK